MKKGRPKTPNNSQKLSAKYGGKLPNEIAEKFQVYISKCRVEWSTNRNL